MQGIVKWFHTQKGYGFLTDSETKKEIFIHYSQIQMEGFKTLHEDDIVEYELGMGNGKQPFIQAVNVQPFLTMKMIEDSLKEENLSVKTMKDAHKVTKYLVVDANDVLQTSEHGIDFINLAAFAGFDTEGLSA